jgi:hypothetical protein
VEDFCLLAATENGNWHLGIGDPTPVGWITAFAYLAASLACAMVWTGDRRARRHGRPGSPVFWLTLSLLLLFLGINKQLDLQTLLNDIGRRKARAEGWYGNRRYYQTMFIGAVTVAGLFAIGLFSWLARKQWKRSLLGLIGTVFLFVFVLIRASSIHHVDVALQWKFAGAKWNWILELSGIAVVLLGAAVAWLWRGRLGPSPET